MLAFLRHADRHYRRADGTPTGEYDNYLDAVRPLRKLCGSTPARDFGPKSLKAVRHAMVEQGLARKTINQRVGKIVRLFKWAVEEELVPPERSPRAQGRPGAPEGPVGRARAPAPPRPGGRGAAPRDAAGLGDDRAPAPDGDAAGRGVPDAGL